MAKFHITFGERKKIVTVDNVKNIPLAARKVFNIKAKFFLQLYIAEIDDWVDLEDISELEDNTDSLVKLKVCKLCV